MRYFIIGYKSSGKTTLGKKLAKKLGMHFIDLDDEIENITGRKVIDIFEQDGEEKFRGYEWKALNKVVEQDHVVISTGGGTPCHCNNMNLMEKYGEVIYFRLDDETLVNRLSHATKDRPIVKNKTMEELKQYVSDLRNSCEHHYQRAKYIIDVKEAKLEEIISSIKDEDS